MTALCAVCPGANPKQPEPGGLVCFGCSNRILRQLRELEEYLPTLSLLKAVTGEARHSPGYGSQSPADDQVIHLTDWRSGWDALDGLGAVATIHSWATAIREDRDFQPPGHVTLGSEISALRANHAWIVAQPFVDEYAAEVREIHAAVRAAAGDAVPRSVGQCITIRTNGECRGSVYELPDASGVKCSDCGRTYTGTDLDRLRVAQEAS